LQAARLDWRRLSLSPVQVAGGCGRRCCLDGPGWFTSKPAPCVSAPPLGSGSRLSG